MKAACVVGAVVLAAVLAVPAHSTIRERGTAVNEEFSYDCGPTIQVHEVWNGTYRLREGKGESEGAFLLLDLSEAMVTFTHTETGEWYRVHLDGTFNEVKARRVEGSILEFRAVEAGQRFTVYDSVGNVVMRDRGAIKYRFLFDTGGDDEPGGEWLEFYDFQFAGQHEAGPIIVEGGPCALAEHLLG
jgi:hypothetical protein